MTGHLSASELRRELRLTQADFAACLGLSDRTIRRIEKGLTVPSANAQRRMAELAQRSAHIAKPAKPRVRVISVAAMQRNMGKPGKQWIHWSQQRRALYWHWRTHYRRVLADAAAGLCTIAYRR